MSTDLFYTKHLAFNRAWERVKSSPELPVPSYTFARRYHHSPDRLAEFKDYKGYMLWFTELYESGQCLVSKVSRIARSADHADSRWCSSKRKLRRLLVEYRMLNSQLVAFRADVAECQICFLASGIHNKTGYSDSLSGLLRQLDTLDVRIVSTLNQKLNEIGTIRIALFSLAISLMSLVAKSCIR